MDIGTGDGRFVLDQAKTHPHQFCIGIDPVAAAMAESSQRAAKKPERGGLPNVLFVNASVETLPEELTNIATDVTINYPWGSLLRAVITPELSLLQNIAHLARPNAKITLLINYSTFSDAGYVERLGLPQFNISHMDKLIAAYREAGLEIVEWRLLDKVPYRTTWGQKLTLSGQRNTLLIVAKKHS